MVRKEFLEAIATLTGLVIGAGVLGIPFVVARAGFLTGLINIIFIGIAILIINLYTGEVILRTKGDHQLTGYAERYLGKTGRRFMIFSMIFGLYGALIAYTIKEGDFLHAIFYRLLGGSPVVYSIIFFVIVTFLIYKGFQVIEDSELVLMFFFLLVVLVIIIFSFSYVKTENLVSFNASKIFIPYGVVLFAYLGMASIPEMKKELKKNIVLFKKAIIFGSLIPIAVYLFFAIAIVGVTGLENVTEDAILGLAKVLGSKMLFIGTIFGILTMATSFLACGLALKDMYCDDFRLKKGKSFWITCLVPLVIFFMIILLKVDNAFFKVLDITGALAGGILGVLVVLMFWKAKKVGERKPEYSLNRNKLLGFILIIMFLFGMVYEILQILGFLAI